MMQVEVKVRGGFPVLVHFLGFPAEPDVGIMADYGEVEKITLLDGRPCPWLENKFSDDDWTRIEEAMDEHINNYEPDRGE